MEGEASVDEFVDVSFDIHGSSYTYKMGMKDGNAEVTSSSPSQSFESFHSISPAASSSPGNISPICARVFVCGGFPKESIPQYAPILLPQITPLNMISETSERSTSIESFSNLSPIQTGRADFSEPLTENPYIDVQTSELDQIEVSLESFVSLDCESDPSAPSFSNVSSSLLCTSQPSDSSEDTLHALLLSDPKRNSQDFSVLPIKGNSILDLGKNDFLVSDDYEKLTLPKSVIDFMQEDGFQEDCVPARAVQEKDSSTGYHPLARNNQVLYERAMKNLNIEESTLQKEFFQSVCSPEQQCGSKLVHGLNHSGPQFSLANMHNNNQKVNKKQSTICQNNISFKCKSSSPLLMSSPSASQSYMTCNPRKQCASQFSSQPQKPNTQATVCPAAPQIKQPSTREIAQKTQSSNKGNNVCNSRTSIPNISVKLASKRLRNADYKLSNYRVPRRIKPRPYVTKQMYAFLEGQLTKYHGLEARLLSEEFVSFMCTKVESVIRKKSNYHCLVNDLLKKMVSLKIVQKLIDFHIFIEKYLPNEFRAKAIPCFGCPLGPPPMSHNELYKDLY